MTGIDYLLMGAGLVSFASMGIVHKLGNRVEAAPLGISFFAMLTASVITFTYAVTAHTSAVRSLPPWAALLALPFGAAAGIGLWMFQRGLRYGHIATSWLLINLSSGIPTVLSIVFYHESLSWKKVLVFLLVLFSLILLWWDRRSIAEESH